MVCKSGDGRWKVVTQFAYFYALTRVNYVINFVKSIIDSISTVYIATVKIISSEVKIYEQILEHCE